MKKAKAKDITHGDQPLTRRHVKEAEHFLRLAEKVYQYRRDVLSEASIQELSDGAEKVRNVLDRHRDKSEGRPTWDELEPAVEELERALRKHGGTFYPKSGWSENIEMVLVAAILAIGIRTFFFQPFKIPTNSMYPTYNGLNFVVHESVEDVPGALERTAQALTLGAKTYILRAPADGELKLPIASPAEQQLTGRPFKMEIVEGRKFLVLPSQFERYHLVVGDTPVSIDVPLDFNMTRLIQEALVPDGFRDQEGSLILTGRTFEEGEVILAFSIITGDALFVDRFTYNFVQPDVGDPFVFRTKNIIRGEDKYYIKRLVGREDDTLYVRPPVLYSNGEPIEGAEAFELNAERAGEYDGYQAEQLLARGQSYTVPDDSFFAMGDNSDQSRDSRYFGPVPEQEVVGRAVFIYYPFGGNWGLAK